jgi:ATP synthase protein I
MWQVALRHGALGLEMGISVALGLLAGWWLDGKFGSSPWLTLVFLLLGIVAAFRALYRAARSYQQQGK